jgi:hypothetical protein
MTRQPKTPSEVLDELLINSRRLAIAHVVLGVSAVFIFLSRPGIYNPSLRVITRFRGGSLDVILHALFAWLPYLVSWSITRVVLPARDRNATLIFILFAAVLTVASIKVDYPIAGTFTTSALMYSCVLTMSLAAACGICVMCWRNDA